MLTKRERDIELALSFDQAPLSLTLSLSLPHYTLSHLPVHGSAGVVSLVVIVTVVPTVEVFSAPL